VLDYLCLDIVKVSIEAQGFFAPPFGAVALHVPHTQWNILFATELRLRSVDCNPPHYRDNTIFLLSFVHVEQNSECTSTHTPKFLAAKLIFFEHPSYKQNMAVQGIRNLSC
jgi:hypothetical protein